MSKIHMREKLIEKSVTPSGAPTSLKFGPNSWYIFITTNLSFHGIVNNSIDHLTLQLMLLQKKSIGDRFCRLG